MLEGEICIQQLIIQDPMHGGMSECQYVTNVPFLSADNGNGKRSCQIYEDLCKRGR
jgi:hypothetical protein